jgi:Protein of unknown function (DUF1761)
MARHLPIEPARRRMDHPRFDSQRGGKIMKEIPVNYWAVLVAAVVRIALGAVWYSPFLFAKSWQALSGISEAEMKARLPKALAVDVAGSFVMAFVLVHAVVYAGAASLAQGAVVGFFNWLGFIAVTMLGLVFYEDRPFRLFLINNGFLALSLIIMGAILAVWR